MSLLLPIFAAVALLFGVSVAIGTLGHRRRRPPRALPRGPSTRALAGDPEAERNAFFAETVALRRALDEVADAGEALLELDRYVDVGDRRPLWRRLSDAGYLHSAAALAAPLAAWRGAAAALHADLRPLCAAAQGPVVALEDHLARADEAADPERLAALQAAVTAAKAALRALEGTLASYQAKVYR
ncbi:MAG: hypothetical protein R3A79_29245 [Nannocystaceae bacterium]